MFRPVGKFPAQQINCEGIAGVYDCQQFTFVGGIFAVRIIESLTVKKHRVLIFPFAFEEDCSTSMYARIRLQHKRFFLFWQGHSYAIAEFVFLLEEPRLQHFRGLTMISSTCYYSGSAYSAKSVIMAP